MIESNMCSAVQRRRLRKKTGCLSCKLRREQRSSRAKRSGRRRHKACDETKPVCDRCSRSGHRCEWPSSTELVDRRYASHPKSRYSNSNDTSTICLRFEDTAHFQLTIGLQVIISRHFIENYYGFLLLPNCHPAFYDGWIHDIQELMITDESLRYSVLANAASHIHNRDTNPNMQSLALQYYSKSIKGLSYALIQADDPYLESCDGLLMSIMLLYLHGVSVLTSTCKVLLINRCSVWVKALISIYLHISTQQCEF